MKALLLLLLTFFSLTATAQKNKGYNRVSLSYNWQNYLNEKYVDNDTKGPTHPLHAHNTFGYNFGLEYERTTRYGLILNVGFLYGIQRHNVDIISDLSHFDPEAASNLEGTVYRDNISGTYHYISPRLMLGYRKGINNKWAVAAKAGVSRKMFLDGEIGGSTDPVQVSYDLDDQSGGRTAGFLAYQHALGDEHPAGFRRIFHRSISTFEFYLGVERNFNNKYFKHISLGIDANRSVSTSGPAGQFIQAISRETWNQTDQSQMNVDWYHNKNLSWGLRLGIGLWK